MTIFDRILQAQELLGKTQGHSRSPEEKELFDLAIDALWFVWREGLADEFSDYREDIQSDAPPRIVAAFNTRDEADVWLKVNPKPPNSSYVLIANDYHVVMSFRERNIRSLVRQPTLEFYLEEMIRGGLPPAVATFDTRAEADAWFNRQTEPPAQAVIQIGGEHYLAVYYRNIHHRTVFPFSIAKRLEDKEGQ